MLFDKTQETFPIKKTMTYLSHCGISPLYPGAARAAIALLEEQQQCGSLTFGDYYLQQLDAFKAAFGQLLRTDAGNMAAVRNTSEALSMVANGYPFQPGDEVVSFVHEYPANHYPWRLQERRGVTVKMLRNIPARSDIDESLVGRWSMAELEKLVSPRTRVIALSHVQFTSGFAADLPALGAFCRERGIDLIVDVAQSLGCMPVFPEAWNIAALASAGWKWLLGPFGIGVFYTSPAMREKLAITQIGAETMQQGMDFLDHTWNPHPTARRFEYSSSTVTHVAALAASVNDLHNTYGPEAIFREIVRLQDVFLEHLDQDRYQPLRFEGAHRSAILSVYCKNLEPLQEKLSEANIVCTVRGGFLRMAPHFYNSDEEVMRLAEVMNNFAIEGAMNNPG